MRKMIHIIIVSPELKRRRNVVPLNFLFSFMVKMTITIKESFSLKTSPNWSIIPKWPAP